jgi:hypothetical protein
MNESIASAPAAVWNRKNLPSNIERFGERGGRGAEAIKELPAAIVGFARRQPGLAILGLAAITVLGLVWYFSERD